MKRLFLIFHGRFPSEKAASLFAAKSCEAFAKKGVDVILLVPRRFGRFSGSPYDYYKLERNFKIVFLPVVDLFFLPFSSKFSFYVSFLSFSVSSFFYLMFRLDKNSIVYSNESLPLLFASFLSSNTFYEMHDFPESKLSLFGVFLGRIRWILVHNRWKMERLKDLFNVNHKKLLYEPNAVEIDEFNIRLTKAEARAKLKILQDKKIVLYTGHLYSWKGVDNLIAAAEFLDKDILIYLVGGTEKDIEKTKKQVSENKNIVVVGNRPHSEIPCWQKSADVLVLPNTAKEKISKYYTSPMKLFEYMASGTPIVASDLPSIREILNENNAVLVEPDNPAELARGIKKVLGDGAPAEKISKQAFADVQNYTWQKRAERILEFIGRRAEAEKAAERPA